MVSAPSTCTPAQERDLLSAITTSTATFAEIAAAFDLAVIDLLELIASPDFQSKLVAIEHAAAHAIRVRASLHLGIS